MTVKPGDTVLLARIGNNVHNTSVGEPEEKTVTRVGRKYIYIKLYGSDSAFHADTGYEKTDYTAGYRIFTPETYAEHLASQKANERLELLLRNYGWQNRLTADQKNRIADIIAEGQTKP